MHRYPIKLLTLRSGEQVEGVALLPSVNQDKEECIKLSVSGQETTCCIDGITELEVCRQPHFKQKSFKTS